MRNTMRQRQERLMNSSVHSARSTHNRSVDKVKEIIESDHKAAESLRRKKQAEEDHLRVIVHEAKQANEDGVIKSLSRLRQQKAAQASQARQEKSLIKERLNETSVMARERQRK